MAPLRRIASHRDTLPRDDLHPLLSRRITCSNTSNVATTSSDTFRSHHPHGDQHSTNNNPLCTRAATPRRAGHHVIQVSIPPFPIPNPGHRLDTTPPPPPPPPTPTNPPGRFPSSTLHQRDSRNDLFKGYTGAGSSRTATTSPSRLNPSGYGGYNASPSHGLSGTTTPAYNNNNFRPATPNARGQYSDAVLNELESQNDAQVDGILGKVKILKDVSPSFYPSPPPKVWLC